MHKDSYDVLKMQNDEIEKLLTELKKDIKKSDASNAADRATIKKSDERVKAVIKNLDLGITDEEVEKAHAEADKETERLLAEIDEKCQVAEEKSLSYDDLVELAHSRGYENTKIQDLLTEEEIRVADERFNKIEAEFEEKTKLTKKDAAFLATAVALQAVRQYVLPPFIEKLNKRMSASKGAKIMEEGGYTGRGKLEGRYYYATYDTIKNLEKVPFDVIPGSRELGIGRGGKGFDGNSHRYRTLGHDPFLGLLFGTVNIITNTVTIYNGETYHVQYIPNAVGIDVPHIVETPPADTITAFLSVFTRILDKNEPGVLTEAFKKELYHLASDALTKQGLPLPGVQVISPDFTQMLAEEFGLDTLNLASIGISAAIAEFINFIIAAIHSLFCVGAGEMDFNLYKVRTRKIILYSNAIATTSNLVAVGIGAAIGNATGNPELTRQSVKYLDVGGLLVTIKHLFSDVRFIMKVKEEFINSKLDPLLQEELRKFDEYLTE